MATDVTSDPASDAVDRTEGGSPFEAASTRSELGVWPVFEKALHPLSSLRLTVWLFAASIFILFVGTLAQTRMDIWEVVDTYFRFRPGALATSEAPFLDLSELFVRIDADLFFPDAFQPGPGRPIDPPDWLAIWFPKAWTIGLVMLLNLSAAHLLRFKLQAKGRRLLGGLALTGFGVALTYGVIATTGGSMGFQNESALSYDIVWKSLLFAMLLLGAGAVYGGILLNRGRGAERATALAAGTLVAGLAVYLGVQPEQGQLTDASMRILWHLLKATVAGLVLLAGCWLLFKKRAGIVLLHAGVMLLMIGEIIVGLAAVEGRMGIFEGRSSNYVEDIRDFELAISTVSDDGTRTESIVASDPFRDAASGDGVSGLEAGPFEVAIARFEPSGVIEAVRNDPEGIFAFGSAAVLRAAKRAVGVGEDATRIDYAGAVVTLTAPDFEKSLVLSTGVTAPTVTYDGREYEVDLRFKRTYKPYTVTLKEMRYEEYIGTDTPRDYSAIVAFADPSKNVSRPEHRIWMNNPLRYGGDTFYQSSYIPPVGDQPAATSLQVVSNVGWTIPYVACMLTAVGMAAQFLISLLRYVDRRRGGRLPEQQERLQIRRQLDVQRAAEHAERPDIGEDDDTPAGRLRRSLEKPRPPWAAIAVAASIAAMFVGRYASPKPIIDRHDRDLTPLATLPVVEGGRLKPFSSLALNAMLVMSDKQSAKVPVIDEDDPTEIDLQKVSALEWLVDLASGRPADGDVYSVVLSDEAAERLGLPAGELQTYDAVRLALDGADFDRGAVLAKPFEEWTPLDEELLRLSDPPPAADAVRVLRIESERVQQTLKLPRRKGLTYSFAEVSPGVEALRAEAEAARAQAPSERTLDQRKAVEAASQIAKYFAIRNAFAAPRLPSAYSDPRIRDDAVLRERAKQAIRNRELAELRDNPTLKFVPLLVPNEVSETDLADKYKDWLKLPDATLLNDYLAYVEREPMDGTILFRRLLEAAASGEGDELAAATDAYKQHLARIKPKDYSASALAFEDHYNRFAPFWTAAYLLYLPATLCVIVSWLARDDRVWGRASSRWGRMFTVRNMLAAALTFVVVAFCVHTYAIAARMAISGRPPVTNLYTVSVFVGWAAALFGLGLELVYRRGLGSLIAGQFGFTTLTIGHVLAQDGDTFTVLQAVLDTQFWLATHVVIITLGYTATLVAGFIGIIYLVRGVFTSSLDAAEAKSLARMCYGVNCFAILFSFVGTVLGGLWADDSWGRFWGWDPKENGALMIVLWNALVLHAHWGRMIGQRGLAVLSVLGNIVVSWSWFGVNELGVGMHSYGFTDGVLLALALFAASQIAIAACGLLPTRFWASRSLLDPSSRHTPAVSATTTV